MKTTEKTFDAVKFMRQQRDKLSEKLSKMTKKEILEYFKKRKNRKQNQNRMELKYLSSNKLLKRAIP
jgi:hypothetical protein